MFDFLLVSENLPFSIALMVMFFIAAIEGVGMLFGLGVSTLLETLVPDFDVDVSAPDINSNTTLSHFLSWLRIGEVPFLIIIVVFLTFFGLLGLILQKVSFGLTGHFLPSWLAVLPVFFLSLPCVRFFSGLAKLMPQDETEAVSEDSFVGLIAIITIGNATKGSPAEARVQDVFKRNHYIMVEPDNDDEVLESGAPLLIIRKAGVIFKAINNPSKSLV